MRNKKYLKVWLLLVQIEASKEFQFNELIDFDESEENNPFVGGWCNILIENDDIEKALELAKMGLKEKHFEIIWIDSIENLNSLIKNNEVANITKQQADYLLKSEYVFLISSLTPYF